MKRKRYEKEFIETILELRRSGKRTSELSKEYNVSMTSINRWSRLYDTKDNTSDISASIEDKAKIKALEKELLNTQIERDILKKAVSIFSKSDR